MLFCGTFHRGVGGGLCQLSNLIYWMTLHTDLTVTERYRHSYDVFPDENRTQPFGSGATCVYNYRDLMVENRTVRPLQLSLQLTATELRGAWLSPQSRITPMRSMKNPTRSTGNTGAGTRATTCCTEKIRAGRRAGRRRISF